MVCLRCSACSSPTYLTLKLSTTSVNCIGIHSCVKKRGPTCSVGSLSCWVSFPETRWPINLPVVSRTCRDWLWYTLIHYYLLCPWVYMRWWSRWGCPWCWCICIPVIWLGSWDKSSRCPWSWTWCFLWILHYWRVSSLPTRLLWVLRPRRDSWFDSHQGQNGFYSFQISHCVHCKQKDHRWHTYL